MGISRDPSPLFWHLKPFRHISMESHVDQHMSCAMEWRSYGSSFTTSGSYHISSGVLFHCQIQLECDRASLRGQLQHGWSIVIGDQGGAGCTFTCISFA
jgi:hypothetical protein